MRPFKLTDDGEWLVKHQRKAAEAYEAYAAKLAEITRLLYSIQIVGKPDWITHEVGLCEVMQAENAQIDLGVVTEDDRLVDVMVMVYDDNLETAANIKFSELIGDFIFKHDLSDSEKKDLAALLRKWADEAERP